MLHGKKVEEPMRTVTLLTSLFVLAFGSPAVRGEAVVRIVDRDGAAARLAAPACVPIDLAEVAEGIAAAGWQLAAIGGPADEAPLPAQFEPESPGARRGRLWWIVPPGSGGERRYRIVPLDEEPPRAWEVNHDAAHERIDVAERAAGRLPVLRYNHGAVPVREGTHPHFAPGESYERGDYIHPLFGPDGEELTEDYPRDHPHHRGVWWSWPVTRWGDQIGDIWAVVQVWSRPVAMRRIETGPVFALLEAENVWKFGKDEVPIVREEVLIRAFRQTDRRRFVDVEVRLTALADEVAVGGRPKAGYGGFSLRAAPCDRRAITLFADPEGASPRRSWIDYSGVFSGGRGMAGVAIFEHPANPDYPNPLHEYPQCNCVMPAYPDQREVRLSRDEPLVLKHRLYVHPGGPNRADLAAVWAGYARPPETCLEPCVPFSSAPR